MKEGLVVQGFWYMTKMKPKMDESVWMKKIKWRKNLHEKITNLSKNDQSPSGYQQDIDF